MDNVTLAKKKPQKILAIELFALNPSMTIKQVADKVGVAERCVSKWREDPMFIDKIYDRYMVEFGSQIPAVVNAMVREGKHGNVQAARLVLEHSGLLVKNINITVDSPFEKFLKSDNILDAEVIEAIDAVEITGTLPERIMPTTPQTEKIMLKAEIDKDKNKKLRNIKRKKWYKWNTRAKAVGIEPLKAKRPTKGQRIDWEQAIIKAEKG